MAFWIVLDSFLTTTVKLLICSPHYELRSLKPLQAFSLAVIVYNRSRGNFGSSEKYLSLLVHGTRLFSAGKFWVSIPNTKIRFVYKGTSHTSYQRAAYPEVGHLPAQCMSLYWCTDPNPLTRGKRDQWMSLQLALALMKIWSTKDPNTLFTVLEEDPFHFLYLPTRKTVFITVNMHPLLLNKPELVISLCWQGLHRARQKRNTAAIRTQCASFGMVLSFRKLPCFYHDTKGFAFRCAAYKVRVQHY